MPLHRDRHRRRSVGYDNEYPSSSMSHTDHGSRAGYPASSVDHSSRYTPSSISHNDRSGYGYSDRGGYSEPKTSLVGILKNAGQGSLERPKYERDESFGNETTAATVDGPVSKVPKHLRHGPGMSGLRQEGYAHQRPMVVQSNASLGDRIHGAAKQVVGRVTLDHQKVEEGRAMQFGMVGAPGRGQQAIEPGYRGSSGSSSGGSMRRTGRKYYY